MTIFLKRGIGAFIPHPKEVMTDEYL